MFETVITQRERERLWEAEQGTIFIVRVLSAGHLCSSDYSFTSSYLIWDFAFLLHVTIAHSSCATQNSQHSSIYPSIHPSIHPSYHIKVAVEDLQLEYSQQAAYLSSQVHSSKRNFTLLSSLVVLKLESQSFYVTRWCFEANYLIQRQKSLHRNKDIKAQARHLWQHSLKSNCWVE